MCQWELPVTVLEASQQQHATGFWNSLAGRVKRALGEPDPSGKPANHTRAQLREAASPTTQPGLLMLHRVVAIPDPNALRPQLPASPPASPPSPVRHGAGTLSMWPLPNGMCLVREQTWINM